MVQSERIFRRVVVYSAITFVGLLVFLGVGTLLTSFVDISTPPLVDTIIGGLLVMGLMLFVEVGLRFVREAEQVEVVEDPEDTAPAEGETVDFETRAGVESDAEFDESEVAEELDTEGSNEVPMDDSGES